MIELSVDLTSSFKKKINPLAMKKAEEITIRDTTLKAEEMCKLEAPGPGNQLPGTSYRASGNLRRSHSPKISSNEGLVKNSAHYSKYVVHGTSKMPARNYPQKVVKTLSSEKYMTRKMLTELRRQGVIE